MQVELDVTRGDITKFNLSKLFRRSSLAPSTDSHHSRRRRVFRLAQSRKIRRRDRLGFGRDLVGWRFRGYLRVFIGVHSSQFEHQVWRLG